MDHPNTGLLRYSMITVLLSNILKVNNILDKKSSLVKTSLWGHAGTTVLLAGTDILDWEYESWGATAGVITHFLAFINYTNSYTF